MIIWLVNKAKIYKLKQKILSEKYGRLLDDFKESVLIAEKSKRELDELLFDKDNRVEIASVTPSMFRKDGETKFRNRFTQLYPTFLHNLKEAAPNITKSEEILGMLIILGQNTDQIVDILCIERGSVNMSRYRLRTKLKLNKEDSLEEYLKSLL